MILINNIDTQVYKYKLGYFFANNLTIFYINILKKNYSYDINLNRNIIHVERQFMKNIKNYNIIELKQELENLGEKPYRADQIFKWIYKENVTSFDEMTDLSLELREKLKKEYRKTNIKGWNCKISI